MNSQEADKIMGKVINLSLTKSLAGFDVLLGEVNQTVFIKNWLTMN